MIIRPHRKHAIQSWETPYCPWFGSRI